MWERASVTSEFLQMRLARLSEVRVRHAISAGQKTVEPRGRQPRLPRAKLLGWTVRVERRDLGRAEQAFVDSHTAHASVVEAFGAVARVNVVDAQPTEWSPRSRRAPWVRRVEHFPVRVYLRR